MKATTEVAVTSATNTHGHMERLSIYLIIETGAMHSQAVPPMTGGQGGKRGATRVTDRQRRKRTVPPFLFVTKPVYIHQCRRGSGALEAKPNRKAKT